MPTRFEDLLRQYERELGINHLLREEFARDYPQLAGALGAAGAAADLDPHVQRLMQGVALMNAQTALRIERSQDAIAEALLQANFPEVLRPFPSCTVVQFDLHAAPLAREQLAVIERGADLLGPPAGGIRCRFRTAGAVTLAPLRLARVRLVSAATAGAHARVPAGVSHILSIDIESLAGPLRIGTNAPARLRIFVDAEPALSAALRDTLFLRGRCAWIAHPGADAWIACPAWPVAAAGFADDDALLPFDSRSHGAFRSLLEYACFPPQFEFLDLDLAALASVPPSTQITLHLGVAGLFDEPDVVHLLSQVNERHLRLFCTCAVNLIAKAAGPVDFNHTRASYPLPSDAARPDVYDIYSIDRVTALADGVCTTFRPLFSLEHGMAPGGTYWAAHRDETLAHISPGYEHALSLEDGGSVPLGARPASLSVDLTCTNRDLPHLAPVGAADGDFTMAALPGVFPIRALRKLSHTYRFGAPERWRVVAHLALTQASLTERAALAELLALYNLPRSPELQRQADGINAVASQPARLLWTECGAATAVRGVEVSVTLDEQAFAGSSAAMFITLLDHLLGGCVHVNSFVQLTVLSLATGKVIARCKPRSGSMQLL
ncbi:MAG: type VI secretion system baseplate subunit TssF [Telluria sp.]